MTKTIISKNKSHAFGKDIFLLGTDIDGTNYWIEAPKWDCGWYWGFGYVETYTNNRNPEKSKDINSHQHIDSSFLGKQDVYNIEKQAYVSGKYVHNLYDSPNFAATTFTKDEGWTLSELFNSFYTLQRSAEFHGRGSSHTATNPCAEKLMNKEWAKHINEVMIPEVTGKIIEILTPKNK